MFPIRLKMIKTNSIGEITIDYSINNKKKKNTKKEKSIFNNIDSSQFILRIQYNSFKKKKKLIIKD